MLGAPTAARTPTQGWPDMPNVAITLTEEEQIELQQILVDRDERAAYEFLRRVVKAKVDRHIESHCKPLI